MTHYFSRISVEPGLRRQKWIHEASSRGDAYQDHALIWRLFPGDGRDRDFVFRRLDEPLTFLVVSEREPVEFDPAVRVQSKRYEPVLEEGAMIRFDLRANPVVSRRDANGKSRRHDVLADVRRKANEEGDPDLAGRVKLAGENWLLARAEEWGLCIDRESLIQTAHRKHRLTPRAKSDPVKQDPAQSGKKHEGGREIQFSSLDYQGIATVRNSELLQKALLHGVGHAKGFGCGLLLVKYLR